MNRRSFFGGLFASVVAAIWPRRGVVVEQGQPLEYDLTPDCEDDPCEDANTGTINECPCHKMGETP